MASDDLDWRARVADILSEPAVSYSRHFYAPGELADSAVVITVGRVGAEDYRRLATGEADYRATVAAL